MMAKLPDPPPFLKQRLKVHENISKLDPRVHDPKLIKRMQEILREEQINSEKIDPDGFVSCYLVVQSVKSETRKLRFRVKLKWTGLDVKSEILRLYEIPIDYQVIIVNDHVIPDNQSLEDCNFHPREQVVYTFLRKKPIAYVGSGIRLRDILPSSRDVTMRECEDATTDFNEETTKKENDESEETTPYRIQYPMQAKLQPVSKQPNSLAESGYFSQASSIAADGTKNVEASKRKQQGKKSKKKGKKR